MMTREHVLRIEEILLSFDSTGSEDSLPKLATTNEDEGNSGGAYGHMNRTDGLPKIWKANILRLRLSKEINTGGY